MGTSASFALARKITACIIAALLSLALVPAFALAEDGHSGAEGSEGAFGLEVPTSPQPPSDPSTEASGSDVTLSGAAEGGEAEGSNKRPLTLASGLAGAPSNFINSDVALDSEPVIGSFTVDGLTYAVIGESHVELVGVAPSVILSGGSEAAGVEGSNSNQASEAGVANLALPESISYEGVDYTLTSIAPYAFYLSGVTDVELPASVPDVDDRAFRSSDVANVSVAEGNPTYSSFDGALYSADKTRLLLIPEGRVGAVLLPREAEVAEAGKFSHCSLVDAISVEDGAAFASENGLLYTSDLTTLLRVPAGATDITIREGCTTIAAGALAACAKLATINAPATVTSISPDVFHAIPTVSLPAASVILGESGEAAGAEGPNEGQASEAGDQLFAMVALLSADGDLLDVDPASIEVVVPPNTDAAGWQSIGCSNLRETEAIVSLSSAETYGAGSYTVTVDPYWHALYQKNGIWDDTTNTSKEVTWQGHTGASGIMTIYDVAWFSATPNHLSLNSPGGNGLHNYVWFTSGTPGWTLKGFRENASTNEVLNVSAEGLTGNRHFVALWEANEYKVSFNINGGKNEANNKPSDVTATFDSVLPAINANKPKKDGYTFKGWYDTSAATGGTMYYDASNKAVSGKTWDKSENTTLYARWEANEYKVSFSINGGKDEANNKPADVTATFDSKLPAINANKPKRDGYTFKGWYDTSAATDGTMYYGADNKAVANKKWDKAKDATLYARWAPNEYVVSFDVNGGKDVPNNKPSNVEATFGSALPTINANKPTRDGYAFKGWYDTSAATGGTMYYDASNKAVANKKWDKAKNTTLYARWAANPYTIAFDTQGGPEVPSISATYDQDVTLPAPGARNGYRFLGWNTEADGSGTAYRAGIALAKPNLATSGTATLFAQWDAVISAVVPLDVQAQVDVLGLEAPKEAQGCIESRCGEPLKVAEVRLAPLDGAAELFGEGNVSDVFLEVLAEGSASPNARFSLGSSATESDASKLQALTMASYGTRVPISYRFAMPPEVQTSLLEHADPKPVCSVAYTVALVQE